MLSTLDSLGSRTRSTVDMLFCSWLPLYSNLTVQPVDLTGKNVIVTGANAGIGLESTRKFAALHANVTLACRDAAKGEVARLDIVASTGNENVQVCVLDVSSFASVRSFAEEWGKKPVDILLKRAPPPPFSFRRGLWASSDWAVRCSNAGMTVSRFEKTKDGFEKSYETNHLGPFLLTLLLLPSLAPYARVVNISSHGNYAGKQSPTDIDYSKYLAKSFKEGDELPSKIWLALYSDAKLAQVIFGRQLQKRLDASDEFAKKHIVTYSVHPGLVKSTIWNRNAGVSTVTDKLISQMTTVVNIFGISSEQGACTGVWAAVEPKLSTNGGGYFARQTLATPNPQALDESLGAKL